MKIIYFGTPVFAAKTLSFLLEQGVEVAAAVTRPDKPKGRSGKFIHTPVKEIALQHEIPVYQPEKVSSEDFADILPRYDADLFVVVAYGEIVKQHILEMPKKGCINLHASLLPKYRGAAPIQRAVMEGESETGVTIIHMVKKMDAGNMIAQESFPILQTDTFGDVEEKLCRLGSSMLLQVIKDFEVEPIEGIPQDETKVTFSPKVELEDCEIDWSQSAEQIHNLIRGVQPYPGAWCWVTVKGDRKRLKVIQSLSHLDRSGAVGEIIDVNNDGMLIGCGKGAVQIKKLQLEGKKAMAPADLFRGTTIELCKSQ